MKVTSKRNLTGLFQSKKYFSSTRATSYQKTWCCSISSTSCICGPGTWAPRKTKDKVCPWLSNICKQVDLFSIGVSFFFMFNFRSMWQRHKYTNNPHKSRLRASNFCRLFPIVEWQTLEGRDCCLLELHLILYSFKRVTNLSASGGKILNWRMQRQMGKK